MLKLVEYVIGLMLSKKQNSVLKIATTFDRKFVLYSESSPEIHLFGHFAHYCNIFNHWGSSHLKSTSHAPVSFGSLITTNAIESSDVYI